MGDESEYEGGANPRGRSGDLGSVYDIGAPLEAALAYHHGEHSRRTEGKGGVGDEVPAPESEEFSSRPSSSAFLLFLDPAEMTYKSHSVETLGFLCKSAVDRGTVGWSFVSDSVQAHDYIMGTPLGRKLKEKGLCFVSASLLLISYSYWSELQRELHATRATQPGGNPSPPHADYSH